MITKPNLKNFLTSVCLAVFIIGLLSSCAPKISVFNRNGWSVEINAKNEGRHISSGKGGIKPNIQHKEQANRKDPAGGCAWGPAMEVS